MKVQITRKDSGIEVRECGSMHIVDNTLLLFKEEYVMGVIREIIYACTDWLECEVVDCICSECKHSGRDGCNPTFASSCEKFEVVND